MGAEVGAAIAALLVPFIGVGYAWWRKRKVRKAERAMDDVDVRDLGSDAELFADWKRTVNKRAGR